MRAFTIVLLLALLAVSVSAVRFAPSGLQEMSGYGVSVPYKWCGSSTDDATIDSIVSNEFPPVKGDMLVLNVTGNLTKVVTSGTYTIAISVAGFPLPDITGDITDFRSLPWQLGELNFTYSQEIPSEAPSGSYVVKISAVDQDKKQIFCISISFSLKALPGQSDLRLSSAYRSPEDVQAEVSAAIQSAIKPMRTPTPITNRRLTKSQRGVPAMKPMKGGKRL